MKDIIGKVKYIGKSFGVESLTNGKIYDVIEVDMPFLRIIDDSGEDYLWSAYIPACMENPKLYGRWQLIESEDPQLTTLMGKISQEWTQEKIDVYMADVFEKIKENYNYLDMK